LILYIKAKIMSTEEAQAAVQKLNGSDFGGRNIAVSEARPMEKRDNR